MSWSTGWAAALGTLLAIGGSTVGDPADRPDRSDSDGDEVSSSPAANADEGVGEVPRQPTAEDVLRALRKRRPSGHVVEPASAAAKDDQLVQGLLWPEGASMVSRPGHLEKDGEWWMFVTHAEGESDQPLSLRLLPGSVLENMVRATVSAASRLDFVVSGDFTVFGDENYLLPRAATRVPDPRPVRPAPADTGVERPGADDSSTPAADSSERLAGDANVEYIVRRFQDLPTAPAMAAPSTADLELPPDYERLSGSGVIPDGSPICDRPGRLIAEGDGWTFVFESDRPEYPELPMKLLQNRNVELMVETSARGTAGLVFIVSGEVTVFEDENFLLARTARLRMDSGNLRK
ncbi:MAG: hypothetical protein KJ749_06820 [Planctomycetes bacterium]|nr:hypothetical protein [Planctomycetota bacterium]